MPGREQEKQKLEDYPQELPADRERVWNLLQTYSKISPDEIEKHLRDIREKAWSIFPYGCIGHWLFLDCVITTTPEYPALVERIKSGDVFLDAGCAFGYALRQLAIDGAPASNLIGTDIQQGFIDLGYELFKDRATFEAQFYAGDLLDSEEHSLRSIDGRVDVIHASGLFHLFGWDDQVKLGVRLVKFFKPDAKKALVLGRQIGNLHPLDPVAHAEQGLGWYRHNMETWQQLWDVIGEKTGTKWVATGTVREIQRETFGPGGPRAGMNFVISKIN